MSIHDDSKRVVAKFKLGLHDAHVLHADLPAVGTEILVDHDDEPTSHSMLQNL